MHDLFVDAAELLVGEGDRVTGDGRFVRDADGDWFEPWQPAPLIGYGPPGPPPPAPSRFAVRARGVDFETLYNRYERNGSIAGGATFRGAWRDGGIEVETQFADAEAADNDDDDPLWEMPPCPEPPGGWPRGFPGSMIDNLDFDLGDLEDSGAAVSVVTFRPSEDQAVLVVAATDIAAVRDRLEPQLPGRLCVVPSRFTRDQLRGAFSAIEAAADALGVHSWGETCGEDAQSSLVIELLLVTTRALEWAETQPPGLIDFRPTLRRLTGGSVAVSV